MDGEQISAWFEHAAANAILAARAVAADPLPIAAAIGDHWAFRTIALLIIVLATIRAIAAIYGGDVQNARRGPIAFRVHVARALGRTDVRLPNALMPMNLDGVRANCEVFYTYTDRKGRRRSTRLHTIEHAAIRVQPSKLTDVRAKVFGQEISDAIGGLKPEDVVIPPGDIEGAPERIEATPETVRDYVRVNRVLEAWTEDDAATLISVHQDVFEAIQSAREEYIVERAKTLRAARDGNFWSRRKVHRLALNAPSVVGSYYIRFKLSRDPLFILTRHPDRDLKMTAWLTVLTSLFAMVMEAWPLRVEPARAADARPSVETRARPAN